MDQTKRKKTTIKQLWDKKARGERITSIGVYDSPLAQLSDETGFDMLIVGNAGPMSILGHKDPTTVTFSDQLCLTQAVSRVARYGMIVAHLPYMSYHASVAQAIESSARMIREGGADCVKCEGNEYTARYIAEIVRAGIPVMGHIGMQASRKTEQSGFGVKGRTASDAAAIVRTARAFVDAGVFSFIIEQVPAELTSYLSRTLPVPVISLGAGADADGIYHISGDLVGYSVFPTPQHRNPFANVRPIMKEALEAYRDAVQGGTYPPEERAYHMADDEYERFLAAVELEPGEDGADARERATIERPQP